MIGSSIKYWIITDRLGLLRVFLVMLDSQVTRRKLQTSSVNLLGDIIVSRLVA